MLENVSLLDRARAAEERLFKPMIVATEYCQRRYQTILKDPDGSVLKAFAWMIAVICTWLIAPGIMLGTLVGWAYGWAYAAIPYLVGVVIFTTMAAVVAISTEVQIRRDQRFVKRVEKTIVQLAEQRLQVQRQAAENPYREPNADADLFEDQER